MSLLLVRLTVKKGGNEYEGVTPDFAIWGKDDNKAARLEKLLKALREWR